jgi:hypothetical protein
VQDEYENVPIADGSLWPGFIVFLRERISTAGAASELLMGCTRAGGVRYVVSPQRVIAFAVDKLQIENKIWGKYRHQRDQALDELLDTS